MYIAGSGSPHVADAQVGEIRGYARLPPPPGWRKCSPPVIVSAVAEMRTLRMLVTWSGAHFKNRNKNPISSSEVTASLRMDLGALPPRGAGHFFAISNSGDARHCDGMPSAESHEVACLIITLHLRSCAGIKRCPPTTACQRYAPRYTTPCATEVYRWHTFLIYLVNPAQLRKCRAMGRLAALQLPPRSTADAPSRIGCHRCYSAVGR